MSRVEGMLRLEIGDFCACGDGESWRWPIFARGESQARGCGYRGGYGNAWKICIFKKIIPGKYATKERMAINLRQEKFAFLQFPAF